MAEEEQRQRQGEYLRDGVAPPHQVVVARRRAVAGQHVGDGDQKHQLADDGGDHGVQGSAQRLEVARMLEAGEKYDQIEKETGASTATISRVKRCLKYGADGYLTVLSRLNELGGNKK